MLVPWTAQCTFHIHVKYSDRASKRLTRQSHAGRCGPRSAPPGCRPRHDRAMGSSRGMDFEDFESLELGARRPPASYAYTAPPLKQKQK